MNAVALPRRWYSWVIRWWHARYAPQRRPVVRRRTLTLEGLESRSSPTSFGLAAPVELAPPHPTEINSPMRSALGEERRDTHADGWTAPKLLSLLSLPTRPKSDDTPLRTAANPVNPPLVFGSPDATPNLNSLDDLFSNPKAAAHAKPPQTNNNLPNAQTQSGGGGSPGGVSTPNTGAGGSGASSSGAGPAVTNANQFLSAYLNMVGSALPPGTVPPISPAAAAALAANSPNSTSPTTHAASTAAASPTPTLAPSNPAAAPTATHHHHRAGDPLFVLDLNTGETLPANVTLNTFSTWTENLQAQVSGAAVSSYSWSFSNPADVTNVSGQNSANLQFNWASFAANGTPHTDTITVTETAVGGGQLSQTMTYLVAGTDSPAFAASRPTSSATWPRFVTPDQITSQQATADGGPYARLGLADGSVQTAFTMPSYNPNVAPLGLVYNSNAANPQPIFLVNYQLPTNQAVPSTITAQLTLNGTPGSVVYYNTSGLNPGDYVQIALQGSAGLSSGRYPWQITVNNGTNTNYNGSVDIVNPSSSPFGAGWSLNDVEQLLPVTGGVILVNPDSTSLWFASNNQGGFTTPAGDFSTLVQNQDGSYMRTLTDGTQINFNSAGLQTSIVDRDHNTTTFGYNGSNQLTTITDWNNQQTTLGYLGSQLTSITDPAGRKATLGYNGNQLTSITDPASEVWQYGYDAGNHLTALTDPNNHATTFTYNFAGRVSGVTRADTKTEALTAEQMNGLAAPGTGTAGNPATAMLWAAGDQAQFTDPNNNPWFTGLDWLGFGLDVQDADPLADTSLVYRDANGLPWLSADPLGRRTRAFFYDNNNDNGQPTRLYAADDTSQQYRYNSFAEVTRHIDAGGRTTTYTYNGNGDLTQITDALLHTMTYSYNIGHGLVTGSTDFNNNATTYGYDSLRAVSLRTPYGI